MTVSEIGANYMVEVTKDDLLDRIHVKVEINPACFTGSLEGADLFSILNPSYFNCDYFA